MDNMSIIDIHSDDFSYHNISRSQIVIDKYNGECKRIEIPEKISGQQVVEIGEKAFSNNLRLEHVQLPDSVIVIKDSAYLGCRNLKSISFGLGIKKICANAFAECESLQNVQIRSKLDYIGTNAFSLSGIENVEIESIKEWGEESFSLCSKLVAISVKATDKIPENCFLHDIYLRKVRIGNKPQIAKNAFKDCRSFSGIEYATWDFSNSSEEIKFENILNERKRLFFRIKVILKNEPRLESDVVMNKAKRLYEYIAEHSEMNKKVNSIMPDNVINSIMSGTLQTFPHEDLGITVDEKELVHYVDHAVLFKEISDEQYISVKGKLYLFSNKLEFYGGSERYEILLDNISAILEFDGNPNIIEVIMDNENLYMSVPNTEVLFRTLHIIECSANEEDAQCDNVEITLEKMIEGADLQSYIFYFEDVQHSQIKDDMERKISILIEKLHKLSIALEKYPDKVEGTHRFSSYYLPETLRLIFAYQQYLVAGVSKDKMDKVYNKVMEAIDTVIVAVERKVDSIYQVATMDTVAKANALQKIMGQDGYTKGNGTLKH